MPSNKRSFFPAATAIELASLLGYGRSQYTGKCTNGINTTLGETYRMAVRWAAACHKAMADFQKEYHNTLVRADVASTVTAMLTFEAVTAANYVAGPHEAASAADRTALKAAVASDTIDIDVIFVGDVFAQEKLNLGTAASTAENAHDPGQQDASQLRD